MFVSNLRLVLLTALAAVSLTWGGCGGDSTSSTASTSAPPPPPPIPQVNAAPVAVPPAVAGAPGATPSQATAAAKTPAPVDLSAADKKEVDRILQILDWHAENYVTQNNRVPTLEQLKAWKDPNYPLELGKWPDPPPGKKWVINPKSGQIKLENQ